MKWIPLKADEKDGGFFAGMNWEYSAVGYRFSESPEVLELRGIMGWRNEDWLFAVNPVWDWNVSPNFFSIDPEFTASFKLTHKVIEGLFAGIEYYGDIRAVAHIRPGTGGRAALRGRRCRYEALCLQLRRGLRLHPAGACLDDQGDHRGADRGNTEALNVAHLLKKGRDGPQLVSEAHERLYKATSDTRFVPWLRPPPFVNGIADVPAASGR